MDSIVTNSETDKKENLVYHYTTLDALKGIVQKDISLWATRYDHLNDPHEQTWAKEFVLRQCLKEKSVEGLTEDFIKESFAKYSYILSLCDIPDYRNMWRLYCNDGLGICLVLDADEFEKTSLNNTNNDPLKTFDVYRSVYYSTKNDIDKAVTYWLETGTFHLFSNDDEIVNELMSLCAFIKDADFDIENEVRYARIKQCISWNVSYDPSAEDNVTHKFYEDRELVKYRMRNDTECVPYIELHFPANILKGIIVGYKYNYDNIKPYLQSILDEHGDIYSHVNIIKSAL